MSNVVGVLAFPLGPDFGLSAARRRSIRRAYRRALLEKANPRSAEYMRALFAQRYPGAQILDPPFDATKTIILLYPDAIGLGFGSIERDLPAKAVVRVLNGRGREFALDTHTRRALTLRRLTERTMIVEAAALAAVLAATPFILAGDLLRGRR
jgi:hypothetical protein